MVGDDNIVPHVVFDIASYPVAVRGEKVSWKNKDDVLGDGTVRYIPESHTLELHNAHIVSDGENACIHSEQEEFSIFLHGTNTLTAESAGIISTSLSKDINELGLLTIIGSGSLDIQSGQYGITSAYQHILVKECGNLKGDVNQDGKVDISDIVAVINQISGTATYPNADVNSDTKVDISDIVAIINIIAVM